jgi:hypothetical protein
MMPGVLKNHSISSKSGGSKKLLFLWDVADYHFAILSHINAMIDTQEGKWVDDTFPSFNHTFVNGAECESKL